MQVYRGMDIGTAKPTPVERAAVHHHLIDLADPAERFTVARFAAAARAALDQIEASGKMAILVAGSALHLQAVLGDLEPPGEWPELRAQVEAEIDAVGLRPAYDRLVDLDPAAAARTHPQNRRRVVRALEVTLGSGRPFSSFGPGMTAFPESPERPVALIGVWLPRAEVAARIEARVRSMMAAGLLEEVRALAARPAGLGREARQALGYAELLAHVETGAPLAACVAKTITRTKRFARRQRVWFRRDPRVRWHGTAASPGALLPGLLRELAECRCG